MGNEEMTESRKKWLLPVAIAVVLLALVAAVLAFCMRGKSAAPEEEKYDTPYARMHDPVYLKQLDELRAEQREIAKRLVEARAALDAAKEKGEDSQEYRDALAKMEAATKDFNNNRAKAQLAVRERIIKENAAIEAKKESSKKKGE